MLSEHVHPDFALTNTGQDPNPIHTFRPLTRGCSQAWVAPADLVALVELAATAAPVEMAATAAWVDTAE